MVHLGAFSVAKEAAVTGTCPSVPLSNTTLLLRPKDKHRNVGIKSTKPVAIRYRQRGQSHKSDSSCRPLQATDVDRLANNFMTSTVIAPLAGWRLSTSVDTTGWLPDADHNVN